MGFFQKYPVKRVVCLFLRFSFQNKSNFSLKIKIYPDNNIILPCYDNFTPSNVSFVFFKIIKLKNNKINKSKNYWLFYIKKKKKTIKKKKKRGRSPQPGGGPPPGIPGPRGGGN